MHLLSDDVLNPNYVIHFHQLASFSPKHAMKINKKESSIDAEKFFHLGFQVSITFAFFHFHITHSLRGRTSRSQNCFSFEKKLFVKYFIASTPRNEKQTKVTNKDSWKLKNFPRPIACDSRLKVNRSNEVRWGKIGESEKSEERRKLRSKYLLSTKLNENLEWRDR